MPRGFVFRLQPVLDQRQREEERCQRALAEIERERVVLEDALRAIQRDIEETREVMRAQLGSAGAAGNMFTVRTAASGALYLNLRAQRTAITLAGVLRRLETARAELMRAAAARKAVALLRERAYEEYQLRLRRREVAELDELTVMRHGRFARVAGAIEELVPSAEVNRS